MTDDDASSSDADDQLKGNDDVADTSSVFDDVGGRPRMIWSSVTDSGGAPADRSTGDSADASKSSFTFDLGSALERVGGPAGTPPPDESDTDDDELGADEQPPLSSRMPTIDLESRLAGGVAEPTATPSPDPVSEPEEQQPSAAEPPVVTPQHLGPRPRPGESPAPDVFARDEPVPRRRELDVDQHGDSDQRPEAPVSRASVFDEPGDPATASPTLPSAAPDHQPSVPVTNPVLPAAAAPAATPTLPAAGSTVTPALPTSNPTPAPVAASAIPTLPASGPTLPAAAPQPSPSATQPAAQPVSATNVTALRSAQMRADKKQRGGKLFVRSLLAFVLVAGLVAAALVFGRSLLFDTEWDAELTPIVNDVQAARGADFDRPVPLEVVPAGEYGDRLRALTIGDLWVESVPQWRALGLASGDVTADSVGLALAAAQPAFYDPAVERIYRSADASAGDAADDLRVALEQAFAHQMGADGPSAAEPAVTATFVGVSSPASIVDRAVERFALLGSVTERDPAPEGLPLPIAYEMAAIEVLGEELLVVAGVDADAADPAELAELLDDDAGSTPSALLMPGDSSLVPPIALGVDDWSLAWSAYLPPASVDRLVSSVVADSFRAVERNGVVCVSGVFAASSSTTGASVFASLSAWADAAPAAAQAQAVTLSPERVQLTVCDPGPDAASATTGGGASVDALLDRQLLRLGN